ncbi:MAG: Stk1 family PASTA domain-containing Ser/Thr kinase [Lachnospira sp.]|nr:Stk1 family PASTA domain-containing Ser/Thr kinase [Lachnospira sp.]
MLGRGMYLADRYEIADRIGAGGMSDVYKAMDHKLNRYVAVKVLKPEFCSDKTFVQKFRVEAQSAAGLAHPNVVNIFDVGEENGIYYIVMELVEGITLKKYIEKKGRIPYKEAVSIAIQVAKGIEAAHSHHIVHRDIKPQNIMISREGKVKVTDFGIAKAASSTTITSTAMGSVHYISPEQARGGYTDERTDIYSFGITLYEMLTGTVPFDGDTTVAVAVQHIQQQIQPPSAVVAGIPKCVDDIVIKCTQKKVEFRYQSATEVIEDLKKALIMPDRDFVKFLPGSVTPDGVVQAGSPQADSLAKAAEAAEAARRVSPVKDDHTGFLNNGGDILGGAGSDTTGIDTDGTGSDDFVDDTGYEDDEEDLDDADIDDEDNSKLDAVMKWIGIGIAAAITVVAVFILARFAASGSFFSFSKTTEATSTSSQSQIVSMPNLIGQSLTDAEATLDSLGLKYTELQQYKEGAAINEVIDQSYEEGAKIRQGATVTLTVNTGKPATTEEKTTASSLITVNTVTGLTESDAESSLSSQGFGVNISYQNSDSVTAGVVISQSPGGGSREEAGSTITIVVSSGPKATAAPVTEAPTTAAPTTAAPTTAAPATEAPTAAPQTQAPATVPQTQNPNNNQNQAAQNKPAGQ